MGHLPMLCAQKPEVGSLSYSPKEVEPEPKETKNNNNIFSFCFWSNKIVLTRLGEEEPEEKEESFCFSF